MEGNLTVDNYTIVKFRVAGIADQEKDVHETNKSYSSSPTFLVNKYLPRMYIARYESKISIKIKGITLKVGFEMLKWTYQSHCKVLS